MNIGGIPTNIVRGQPRRVEYLKFSTFANLVPNCEDEW